MKRLAHLFLLTLIIVSLSLNSCKKDNGATANDFPVNNTFAMELMAKGIPADVAQFFAAAKMEISKPNDSTCIYLQTFPNGASREMTLRVSPKLQYTPTAGELAITAPGSIPIYNFKYASSAQTDGTIKINMSYYVAKAGLTKGAAQQAQSSAQNTNETPGISFVQNVSGTIATDGAGISWTEVWKTGADVSIGSLIDYAKESGIKVGPLGSLYALASALSSVTGALDLSKQNNAWLAELEALEKCAGNPTNLVSRSDPNYSPAAVAKIQAARSELKQVNAVRFLNMMTETLAGINPVTAVLSVGLKPVFLWSEQTLNDYSENTIMRESRLTVVPCDEASALDGNIDVLWECTTDNGYQVDHEVWHIVTKVRWVYDPAVKGYVSQGSFTFEYTLTGTTYEGKSCTDKKTAAGSIGASGRLMIVNDPAAQNVCSCGYYAIGEIATNVAASSTCEGTTPGIEPRTIGWLPLIKAYTGTGGIYEGEMTNPSCVGSSSTGTEKVKWAFFVPPAK